MSGGHFARQPVRVPGLGRAFKGCGLALSLALPRQAHVFFAFSDCGLHPATIAFHLMPHWFVFVTVNLTCDSGMGLAGYVFSLNNLPPVSGKYGTGSVPLKNRGFVVNLVRLG